MLLTLKEGTDLDTVRGKARDIVADTYQYAVRDASEISDQVGQQINQMLAVLYGLLGLSIAIAILGIVNTLVLSVSERTREIGLMRAVGLGKAQLSGEIITESVLTSLYGTVLGGATGVVLAAALQEGRTYVIPDDVRLLRHGVLRHRLVLTYDALADGAAPEAIIDAIFAAVPTP